MNIEEELKKMIKVCAFCGKEYVGKRPESKTCSDRCRQALHRRTIKESHDETK